MLHQLERQEYSVFSSGLDWVTCTAKNGSASLALERVSDLEVAHQNLSGAQPVTSSWLGFDGYKMKGLFFGRREHDVMLCLSGNVADDVGPMAIQNATNISRLDLQVTICSNVGPIQLAKRAYDECKCIDHRRGRPRSFSFIVGHPAGQTLYINSRSSDNFARIYDKGVESKLCDAGLMWRYELELKRKLAKSEALALAPSERLAADVSDRVHTWLTLRGVEPTWPAPATFAHETMARTDVGRDVLTWYRESLSVSVAKAVKEFGLEAVLQNLGLRSLVDPKARK